MVHKLSLLFLICFTGAVGYTQQYTSSPFSTQGLGEAGGLDDPQFGGIGNCRTAVLDSATVNLFNPSGYALLAKGQPLLAMGVSSRFSNYSYQGSSYKGRISGLNQITMALPLGKRFGMALGLQPFSRKGYNIEQREVIASDTFRYTYLGTGSTQQVIGGLAWKFIDLRRHKFSIGANYSYIFGSVSNERRSELMGNDPEGGVDLETYRVHGAQYSVGMNYDIMLDTLGNQHLRLGAVFSPEQQIKAHRDYFLYFSENVANPNKYDTLQYTVDDKGKIFYPAMTSFGFSYSFRPRVTANYNLKNVYQINLYGDYTSTLWSGYKTEFNGEHETNNFKDAHRFSLGVQYTPNYDSYNKAIGSSYFNRIRYRAGGYTGTLPNIENGEQLSEYGVTVGFGLPIASQKTNSSFNFSVQYGQRSNGQADGLKEEFLGVNFGIILAPSSYDKWFKKYKLD